MIIFGSMVRLLLVYVFILTFLDVAAQSVDILNLAPVKVWLTTDSILGTDTLNGELLVWRDQSGNGYDFTPPNAGAQPKFRDNLLNGRAGIEFDGLLNRLKSPDMQTGNNISILLVAKINSILNNNSSFLFMKNANEQEYQLTIDKLPRVMHFNSRGNNINVDMSSTLETFYSIGTIDFAMIRFLINNSLYGPSSFISQSDQNTPFYLGGFNSMSGLNFEGIIYEFIVFTETLTQDKMDSLGIYVKEKYSPKLDLGADRHMYGFCDTEISAYNPFYKSYLWNTGSTDSIIHVTQNGTYQVTVTDYFGFTHTDSVKITYPNINFSGSPTVCLGDSLIWDTELNTMDYSFLWNNLSNDSFLTVFNSDSLFVQVTDSLNCSRVSDTIYAQVDSFSIYVSLGPDIQLCQGNQIGLVSSTDSIVSYAWSTSETLASIAIQNTGLYSVVVENNHQCFGEDTISVNIQGIAPQPSFTYQNHCTGSNITFTDMSTTLDNSNINDWTWSVQGVELGTSQDFSYLPSLPGNYIVKLEVYTDSGCGAFHIDTIVVSQSPSAVFSLSDPIVCTQSSVSFSNTSLAGAGSLSSIYWDFGYDLSDTSDVPNPMYIYPVSGDYMVHLVVTNSLACTDTSVLVVNVRNSPKAAFLFDSLCVNTPAQFLDNSLGNITNRHWNFGNGQSSTITNPLVTYNTIGNYVLSLVVQDANGCQDDTSFYVHIHPLPTAAFLHSNFCVNNPNLLKSVSTSPNGSIMNTFWNISWPGQTLTSSMDSLLITPNQIGNVTVQLQVIDTLACAKQISSVFEIGEQPEADFSISPWYGNPPLLVNFSNESQNFSTSIWTVIDTTAFGTSFSYVFTDTGSYIVHLLTSNTSGCIDTVDKIVQVGNLKYDIALRDLKTIWDSQKGLLNISVLLENKGNVPLFDARLNMDLFGNKNTISEHWINESGLFAGASERFIFKSDILLVENTFPENICVQANIDDIETILENNKVCEAFNEHVWLSSIYPNPAQNLIYIELFSQSTDPVYISITDDMGQLLTNRLEPVINGLNRIPLDVSLYSDGLYILRVVVAGQDIQRKFEIIQNK